MRLYAELKQIKEDLEELTIKIGERYLGTCSNNYAADYIAGRLAGTGCLVIQSFFRCINWEYKNVILKAGDRELQAFITPYSLSCEVRGDYKKAASIEEIRARNFENRIMLLHGDVCREQLKLSKSTPGGSQDSWRLRELIQDKNPLAVISIAGPQYSGDGKVFLQPLFEDGDFNIPSAYISEEEGNWILEKDSKLYLRIESYRVPSQGSNVIGIVKGKCKKKLVIYAHLDTGRSTPGALDNAGGISALLALARMLRDYKGEYDIEIAALNGENYYANLGEILYSIQNEMSPSDIVMAVNIKGVGYRGKRVGYCCFCDGELKQRIEKVMGTRRGFSVIGSSCKGGLFIENKIPSVVISSENYEEIYSQIAHTSKDTIDKIDCSKVYRAASALRKLIYQLGEREEVEKVKEKRPL